MEQDSVRLNADEGRSTGGIGLDEGLGHIPLLIPPLIEGDFQLSALLKFGLGGTDHVDVALGKNLSLGGIHARGA